MNEIGRFFGGGVEAGPAGLDRMASGGEGPDGRLGTPGEGEIGFKALFGSLMSGRLPPEAQRILRALGLDEGGLDRLEALAGGEESATRDLSLIQPELRVRLERVRVRMLREHGHTVNVVETHRSQARQTELFAQGRTEPGPIVTWTRASAHTEGRAVDVVIDGSYDNREAYTRLQRIAGEEGLKTLGPSDRGHLELSPGDVSVTQAEAPPSGQAVLAAVASVASPARVATPGSTPTSAMPSSAPPPAPGPPASAPSAPAPSAPAPAHAVSVPTLPPELARPGPIDVAPPDIPGAPEPGLPIQVYPTRRPPTGDSASGTPAPNNPGPPIDVPTEPEARGPETPVTRHPGAEGVAHGARRGQAEPDGRDRQREDSAGRHVAARVVREAPSGSPERIERPRPGLPDEGVFRIDQAIRAAQQPMTRDLATTSDGAVRPEAVRAADGQAALDRVTQIRDLQLNGRVHRVSRLLVEVPDGADSIARIDISARAGQISARIDATQPGLADRLRMHVAELHQDLTARGLRPETLLVRDAQSANAVRPTLATSGSPAGTLEAASAQAGGRDTTGDGAPRHNTQDPLTRDANHGRPDRHRSPTREDERRQES